jgi:hypothetical protein
MTLNDNFESWMTNLAIKPIEFCDKSLRSIFQGSIAAGAPEGQDLVAPEQDLG